MPQKIGTAHLEADEKYPHQPRGQHPPAGRKRWIQRIAAKQRQHGQADIDVGQVGTKQLKAGRSGKELGQQLNQGKHALVERFLQGKDLVSPAQRQKSRNQHHGSQPAGQQRRDGKRARSSHKTRPAASQACVRIEVDEPQHRKQAQHEACIIIAKQRISQGQHIQKPAAPACDDAVDAQRNQW